MHLSTHFFFKKNHMHSTNLRVDLSLIPQTDFHATLLPKSFRIGYKAESGNRQFEILGQKSLFNSCKIFAKVNLRHV